MRVFNSLLAYLYERVESKRCSGRNVRSPKRCSRQEGYAGETSSSGKGQAWERKRSGGAVQNQPVETAPAPANAEVSKAEQKPGDLEKSLAVLSKLKDLEFHSRANIETLAELSLTIEEELKQREFAEAIGALYSAQEAFHSKIAAFIETYQTKCESLK